jgi:hypothetical protein
MAILNNSNAISTTGGYDINNSLRFRSSASAYLNQTLSSSNRQTMTWSGWIKIGALSTDRTLFGFSNGGSTAFGQLVLTSSNTLDFISYNAAVDARLTTTQVFRDPSSWYHIMAVWDTTNATSTNRLKLYINGSQVTSFSASTYPAQNYQAIWNNGYTGRIGAVNAGGLGNYYDGYLTEVNFVDGQTLTPSSFGETDTTTGSWKPKAYTGTYGTNGFYLKFSDIATTSGSNAGLGKDFSGNTNYWTTNNISVTAGTTYDAMIDSPTLTSATVANYAVLNPLFVNSYTLTNGNLNVNGNTANKYAPATITLPTTGKFYFEYTCTNTAGADRRDGIGVVDLTQTVSQLNTIANSVSYFSLTGDVYVNSSAVATYSSYTNGDTVQCAIDCDTGKVWFGKSGTFNGSPTGGTSQATTLTNNGNIAFAVSSNGSSTTYSLNGNVNFGQRPFAYTPPTGFVRLNTYNLPDSTIKKGNTVMDATLYTGTGASQSISGLNFQPDLVWVKGRSGATDNALYDAVRGVQLQLESNTTTDQTTETTGLTAFNSNGFTVGALAQLNTSSATYVGWSWKETATSGFDIVTYTGNGSNRTISHSLGVAPKMIIVKARTTASTDQGWAVYHSANTAAPETDYLLLNSTAATADLDTVWNDTAPTSSVFSVGTNALVNTNNDTYVAYCWAEISGFSKFGSYTGNGSADGPFVYTGFQPKYLLVKRTDAINYWFVFDSARDTSNAVDLLLDPNDARAEISGALFFDFLSNGFKSRGTDGGQNASGGTYIYMAFASNPFKNSNAF